MQALMLSLTHGLSALCRHITKVAAPLSITRDTHNLSITRHTHNLSQTISMETKRKPQTFDHFLVLDFEATCDRGIQQLEPQEIIEFPVIKVNSATLENEAIFHTYLQPTVHKDLTSFCTQLTGIIQDMVDGQPHLEQVLQTFDLWMNDHLLSKDQSFVFVTCGDWDLGKMLPQQCEYFNLKRPDYFKRWINIKKAYAEVTGQYPREDMMGMLKALDIKHTGRHHSGIDDCKNITNILKALVHRGYIFHVTKDISGKR